MKDKNIKKQHSAQALSTDDLENVSGGYTYIGGTKTKKMLYKATKEEDAYLESLGYKSVDNRKNYVGPDRKVVPSDEIVEILDKAGFSGSSLSQLLNSR